MKKTIDSLKSALVDFKRSNAVRTLESCGVPIGGDFYALDSGRVFELGKAAAQFGYRKPKSANGSAARYFHDRLQRLAAKGAK